MIYSTSNTKFLIQVEVQFVLKLWVKTDKELPSVVLTVWNHLVHVYVKSALSMEIMKVTIMYNTVRLMDVVIVVMHRPGMKKVFVRLMQL